MRQGGDKRNIKDYSSLVLKGIGMGAADVVPGVSGGTIAFIVGIYEELIDSIKSISIKNLKLFFTFRWLEFWKQINGNFLLAVVGGILISIFSLARLITWLLIHQPVLVWAFFFGLIVASTWFVSKRISKWNLLKILSFIIGAAVAFYVTVATPAHTPDSLPYIFMSGAIAICAMILPGISGSFILVLLGKYFYVMEAVKTLDLPVIITFAAGAVIGLVLFSHLLSYLLRKHHDITVALLAGFMLGSLNKVWPWKTITEYQTADGLITTEQNAWPDEMIWQGFALMIVGFAIVYILEKVSSRKEKKENR